MSGKSEVMLAQEQAVINRGIGLVQEIETALDLGKATEGTLILTNRRLIYAHGAEKTEALSIGEPLPLIESKRLLFSDVEDLKAIVPDPANFEIPLDSIVSVVGHHKEMMAPKLEIGWRSEGKNHVTEFVQQITGASRRKNLNDWAPVIGRLRSGQQKIVELPPAPDESSLEAKVLQVLGNMQEQGLFTIEHEVEERFKMELEPEEVEAACNNLLSDGLVQKRDVSDGDPFYSKVSPLGADDLSV